MEYTVKALAELSGVTARTLRWYDQKGLLKPLRVSDAGYRIYGPEQVDRLQLILFYRALGLELSAIRSILDDRASTAWRRCRATWRSWWADGSNWRN